MKFTTDNLPAGQSAMSAKLGDFDPVEMMMKRKRIENGEEQPEITEYDSSDIKAVEDFCLQNGIVGFSFGKMNPIAALSMLKGQFGMGGDVVANMEAMGHHVVGKDYKQDKGLLHG